VLLFSLLIHAGLFYTHKHIWFTYFITIFYFLQAFLLADLPTDYYDLSHASQTIYWWTVKPAAS